MKNLILILLILSVTSCITKEKCSKYYPPTIIKTDSVKVTMIEHIRDTVFEISSDNSSLRALLECDSLGQVRIKQLISYQLGQRTGVPAVKVQNNILTADCKCDSVKIHALLKDREKIIYNRSTLTTTPPAIEVKFIPGWMWFFGITGMISWGGILLVGIFLFIKSKLKLFI